MSRRPESLVRRRLCALASMIACTAPNSSDSGPDSGACNEPLSCLLILKSLFVECNALPRSLCRRTVSKNRTHGAQNYLLPILSMLSQVYM